MSQHPREMFTSGRDVTQEKTPCRTSHLDFWYSLFWYFLLCSSLFRWDSFFVPGEMPLSCERCILFGNITGGMTYNLLWKKLAESGSQSLLQQTIQTSLVNRTLSLEELVLALNDKYTNVKQKEEVISFKTWKTLVLNKFVNMMHLHKDVLDTGLLHCKAGTNNWTCQEVPGVLPVYIFILYWICHILNDDMVLWKTQTLDRE